MGSFENNQNISFLGSKNALGESVVEQYSSYIGVFKGVGSSTPMRIDNSSFFLTYLVDSEGNTFKIADGSSILQDARSNFLDTPMVITRLDQPTQLNENLAGEKSVTSVGTFTPLLYTQIGEGAFDNVSSISLLPPGIEPENTSGLNSFLTTLVKSNLETLSDLTTEGDFEYITDFDYNTPDPEGVDTVTVDLGTPLTGTGSVTFADPFDSTNSLTKVRFRVQMTIRSRGNVLGLDPGDSATFTLNLIQDRGGVELAVYRQETRILSRPDGSDNGRGGPPPDPGDENTWFEQAFYFEDDVNKGGGGFGIEPGDKFYLKLTRNEGDYFIVQIKDASFGIISQTPPPDSPPNFDNQNPKGYWETGSNLVLTASAYLSEQYGNVQRALTSSQDFGFPPIKDPFSVQEGDLIRFQFNEDNRYNIYEVIPPSSPLASGSRLYLKLNRAIPSNINANNFVLYRIVNDGQYVTIDSKKNETENTEFTGLIIPKYLNPNFSQNVDNIIQQLKQDGIIEE